MNADKTGSRSVGTELRQLADQSVADMFGDDASKILDLMRADIPLLNRERADV